MDTIKIRFNGIVQLIRNTSARWLPVVLFSLFVTACFSDGGSGEGGSGEGSTGNLVNNPPVSSAGPDLTVNAGVLIQLDGSGSSDPNGDVLSYQWTQTSGHSVNIINATTATPSFLTPDGMSADLVLNFSLIVSDGSLDSGADSVIVTVSAAPPAIDNGLRTTITSVLSRGRFTFNNYWTQADVASADIPYALPYEGKTGISGNVNEKDIVHPYTITVVEYEERKRQCQEDNRDFHPILNDYKPSLISKTYTIRDRKCYPKLTEVYYNDPSYVGDEVASQVLWRYGYYCGGGFGGGIASDGEELHIFSPDKPEPLDGLDYCCRLHDNKTWAMASSSTEYPNECGMLMCIQHVTVQGLSALPADVEEARQYWWGEGVAGGAAFLCEGNQGRDAPAPISE